VEDAPGGLVGRNREWSALLDVVRSRSGVALVHGPHRCGITALTTAVAEEVGGRVLRCGPGTRHVQFQEVGRFVGGDAVGRPISSWSNALERIRRMSEPLVVIDDIGNLLSDAPDLPEALARSVDMGTGPVLVLAGSPSSSVLGLLGRGSPLFGKVSMALSPSALEPVDLARLWGADLPLASLWIDAALGPLPGYRNLADPPGDDLAEWMCARVLAAGSPVVEAAAAGVPDLLRGVEGAVGRSILDAVASAEMTADSIADSVGVPVDEALTVLHALERSGTLVRVRDLLRERRDTYDLADPHLRFWLSLVAPHRSALMAGRADEVWASGADAAWSSNVLARRWSAVVRQHVLRTGVGPWEMSPIAMVGASPGADLVAVDSDRTVVAVGRTSVGPLGLADLREIEGLRESLGVPAATVVLASASDVDPAVEDAGAVVLTPGDVYGIA
jgi:hypothetical protein